MSINVKGHACVTISRAPSVLISYDLYAGKTTKILLNINTHVHTLKVQVVLYVSLIVYKLKIEIQCSFLPTQNISPCMPV